MKSSPRKRESPKHDAENDVVIVKKPVPGLSNASIARFVKRARHEAKLKQQVNVLIAGDRELQKLNRQFRGKNKATDVLSFPALPAAADKLAGDIAVSAEIAAQNAKWLGHEVADEIKILVLHGVLHLAGYDHESDDGEMARKEMKLRVALGLPIGLIERAAVARHKR